MPRLKFDEKVTVAPSIIKEGGPVKLKFGKVTVAPSIIKEGGPVKRPLKFEPPEAVPPAEPVEPVDEKVAEPTEPSEPAEPEA